MIREIARKEVGKKNRRSERKMGGRGEEGGEEK